MTLRSNADEINQILEQQMNERLTIQGLRLWARINYLAYAPEIAAVYFCASRLMPLLLPARR